VENVLAAAAAWNLGVPCERIRVGLETFCAGMSHAPGRFNLLEVNGATVIVDYGHNTPALAALVEAIGQFPHKRRTAVYSTAGDRRDCDLVRQGELLGDAFDRVILYEDHYLRGRKEGEIIALFRRGVMAGSRAQEVQEVRGWAKAMETALDSVSPGELLLVQADVIEETVTFLKGYLAAGPGRREIDFRAAVANGRAKAAAMRSVPVG
jgi:cyanophycin synthetase